MLMTPANRSGDRRGRAVFIVGAFMVLLYAGSSDATIRAAITSQNPRSAFDVVDAAGGSLSVEPTQFIPTTELGLDLPVGGSFQAGVFVNRTEFDTGIGIFRLFILGGSIIRPFLGAQFGWRMGVGLASGSGADHSSVGVTEFVVILPVPGIRGAGIQVVHQILVDRQPSSPNFDVFHVNRIGMCMAML